MKEFTTYSPAMLKIFEQCKKKFEYKYVKGISIPVDTSKMQQGKNIHALANYYLKNYNIDKLEKALTPFAPRFVARNSSSSDNLP